MHETQREHSSAAFNSRRAKVRVTTALLAAFAAATMPNEGAAGEFYAGKTINFILGFDVGDGFDAYARVIGRYLPRHISGNPTLVMQFMPGAGSNRAAAYLYSAAPKDGTTIGALMPNALLGKLTSTNVQTSFDASRFEYLAGAERGTRLCVTSVNSKIRTYEDAIKETASIGATAPGGSTYDYATWHKNAAHAKFSIVSGYKGTADLYLATERGEIDGVCGVDWTALKTQRANLLQNHRLNLIAQDGIEPEPELAALGVPQTWKYIGDAEDRKAVEVIVGFQQAIGKFYLAPPGVPADLVAELREAFAATLSDPEFLAEAGKLGIPIKLTPGDSLRKTVQEVYSASPQLLERIAALLKNK